MKPTGLRQYQTVKRTEMENAEFIDLIESAIDKADQAIGHITYGIFPQVNAELIGKIKEACRILEEALDSDIYKVSL